VGYANGKKIVNHDGGGCVCIIKDKYEQQWERPQRDLHLCYAKAWLMSTMRLQLICEGSGYICDKKISPNNRQLKVRVSYLFRFECTPFELLALIHDEQ
jgi:hypothetical protein